MKFLKVATYILLTRIEVAVYLSGNSRLLQPISVTLQQLLLAALSFDAESYCETNLSLTTGNTVQVVKVTVRTYRLQFQSDISQVNSSQRIQLRFIQSDHRGGFCDCWAVTDLTANFTESNEQGKVPLK